MPLATEMAASRFSLSRFVESVFAIAPIAGHPPRRVDRLPDGRTAVVFRIVARGKGDLVIVGPRTRALLKEAASFEQAVMLQFKPGWSVPLLGVAATELTDAFVPLEDLWGHRGRDLRSELLGAASVPAMVDCFARAFAAGAARAFEPASARLARCAVRLMEGGEVRVESVAERLGVTSRHLRRAFAENIGIGPKDFTRTVRLQRAVKMAATSRDWGRIAVDAGYYDQAHLIGDFRDLVGLSPSAFLRRAHADPGPTGAAERQTWSRAIGSS